MTLKTLTPDDFKFDLLHHAAQLRHRAMNQTSSTYLDEKTTQWIITETAWREFQMSRDFLQNVTFDRGGKTKNMLMGLPVRVTFRDDPDTPPIQLVMEPLLSPR